MSTDQQQRSFRLEDIEAALHRAAAQARKIAEETGTPLVLVRNGRLIQAMVRDGEIVESDEVDVQPRGGAITGSGKSLDRAREDDPGSVA